MMYVYLVKVRANVPYPTEKSYRVTCHNLWTAISRGIKLFRQEDTIKRKKIKDIYSSAIRIGSSNELVRPKKVEVFVEEEFKEKKLPLKKRLAIEKKIAKNTVMIRKAK